MVQITALSSLGFDYHDIDFSKLTAGVEYVRGKKVFGVTYENGFVDEFHGKQFSYNAAGMPNGGLIKSWFEFLGEDPYASFKGLNVSALDITKAARTADTTDDVAVLTRALRGADSFVGSDANDDIKLYGGRDTFYGAGGSDFMVGGRGADTFLYKSLTDSARDNVDQISDFSQAEGDKIDLSAIDADTVTAGDQAFTFIGTGAFSNTAGELRYVYVEDSDNTYIGIDGDGDGSAEFLIMLFGNIELTAADFAL